MTAERGKIRLSLDGGKTFSKEIDEYSREHVTLAGLTVTSADGVVASFRYLEDGKLVEVDPADAVIGVHVDQELRSRWLTVRDAEEGA